MGQTSLETDAPLFSVLIANYNNGIFLMDAINSIRCQSYQQWEIIIVDDASDDCSHDIYKKLEYDDRVHIFYNGMNRGCGYTKRRCVDLANGPLCGFLDPDDTLETSAIEIMVNEHLNNPEASLIYSKYYYADRYLNKIGVSDHQRELPEGISFLEYGKGAISHFASFKKTSYNKTPGIDACYKRAVDHALYYLLEEAGSVRFIDKPLYNYRSNTGSNISTNENSDAAFLWHLVVMTDACRRRGIPMETLVYSEFQSFIRNEAKEAYVRGEDHVRSSRTYKTGKRVLCPIEWLKTIMQQTRDRL